jgi:acyl-CoA synthetase (NDP forming)
LPRKFSDDASTSGEVSRVHSKDNGSSASLRQALLAPRSIAIIGASDDAAKTSSRPLQYLRRAGYAGTIYPINPRRETVLGERAWPSLSALPEAPDHAFILAPTKDVVAAAAECAAAGVCVATILATGFSGGDGGDQLATALKELCRTTGLRILGPSSIGVVDLHSKLILTANAAFAERDLPVGGTFVASHSGSLLGALVSRGKSRSVGFAGLVSVGNEIDLSLGEICSATLDDPNVTGYLLFLESLRHAEDLRKFAIAAAERGKPVVAYKLGRSPQGAELALSHTGALAGEDDIAAAFLRDCGIARVHLFESLLETLPLLGKIPISRASGRPARVGVVTTTGGGAAMVVDGLALRGIDVVKCTDETFARLAKAGVAANHERIIDLTMAGTRYDVMKAALDTMLSAPEFDLLVAVIGSSARFQADLAVQPIIDCSCAEKPLVAFLVPDAPEGLAMLAQKGVPAFRTPESCVDAIAAAFHRGSPKPQIRSTAHPSNAVLSQLNEWDAYGLFDRLGVPHAAAVRIAIGDDIPDLPFAYSVAVKLLSDQIAHKTDVGGVVLGVNDKVELRAAIDNIGRSLKEKRPDVVMTHVLVQPMTSGMSEVLVGFRRDPDVGPVVLLASGGIFTEIYRDRSLRLAPVDRETALEMIDELSISKIFKGFRGRKAADVSALADTVVSFSKLAMSEEFHVVDAEINPLIVRQEGDGVLALDAIVTISSTR